MSSPFVSPPIVKAKSLSCPNCGGPVELRGFAHTLSVVCPQCMTVLDTSNPQVSILQQAQTAERISPQIPLGSRGTLEGVIYEVIGFQIRAVVEEGETFSWAEYLLFNPYKGFRYLSEYHGHWNFIRVLSGLPEQVGPRSVRYQGTVYKQFSGSVATTTYVLGEFPWQIHVGDQVQVADYIAPPFMLSAEGTDIEQTWSLGQYYSGLEIWRAFKVSGEPPKPYGIFSNQPSPSEGKVKEAWRTWLWLTAALVAVVIFFASTASRREVFKQRFTYTPGVATEALVTNPFELDGRPSNIEVRTNTDLHSDWAYFNYALVNEKTERARNFGREVMSSKPNDTVILAAVPAGRYYLRVEPEKHGATTPLTYEIVVRRDVPTYGWFWIAALLLLIPPLVIGIRSSIFESSRWRESDFSSAGS